MRREQSRGPQRGVNAEQASSDYQPKGGREGRAAHVTAKATDSAQDPERALALSGVLAAARGDSPTRNRRGPPRRPTSGETGRISAEREIGRCREGVRGGHSTEEAGKTRVEGRAPASVTQSVAGKREGMSAQRTRSNNPYEKVRKLQRRLWACAKRSRTRRFHALYDRIYRGDVLWEAWRRVRSNRGVAGIDRQTLESIEPIFEADFRECSYGFRPRRSATQAMEVIREAGNRGNNWVIDADIRSYFDSIDRDKLMLLVEQRISDRRVLKLVRKWLECGVMEDGTIRESLAGTPQGGVISPLLANIYLDAFDRMWERRCGHLGPLVRYADDFVVLCRRKSQAKEALKQIRRMMGRLGLELHPDKTRLVNLSYGKEGFEFLGWYVRKGRSIQRNPRLHFVQRRPSDRALKRIRRRVHELTSARRAGKRDVKEIIADLNPVLRGWGNYFRTGNSDDKFNQIDDYVHWRITRWMWRRGGQRRRFRSSKWPHERLHGMGLHRLRGTVEYPSNATPRRPSVSRVRENRTHGLRGGLAQPCCGNPQGRR